MFKKIDLLTEHLGTERREVMHMFFNEHRNTYNVDYDDFIAKTGVENPYTLDFIDSNKELKQTFKDTLDNMFDSYGLNFNAPQEYNAFTTISEDDDVLPF